MANQIPEHSKVFTQQKVASQMVASQNSINCTESSSLDSGYQRSHESLTTSQDYRNHANDQQVYNAYAHERLSRSPFLDKVGGFPQQTALTTRSATGGWNFHDNQQPAIRNHHYSYADPQVPFKYQIDAQVMDPATGSYLATTTSMISSGYNASVDQGIVMDHGPFVCPQNVQPVVPFCPQVVMQLPQATPSTQQALPQNVQPATSSNNDVTKADDSDDEVIFVASYHQDDVAAKRKPRKARKQPPQQQQQRKDSSDDDVIFTGYIPAPVKITRSARKQFQATSSPNTRSKLKRPMAANSKQVRLIKIKANRSVF